MPSDHAGVAAARTHAAALSAWNGAMAAASEYFADAAEAIGLAEFWRVASAVVANTSFQAQDDRANVVHAMNVYEARQWDLTALFVCGCADGVFPRKATPDLFFSAARLEKLLGRTPGGEADEAALFGMLRTRASREVVFTVPAKDAGGRGVRKSRFLEEIPAPETAGPAKPLVVPIGAPARAGWIYDEGLRAELAGLHRKTSTTGLEDLAQCRYRFFSGRTLKLEGPPERPAERLQPRVTGGIVHKALEVWQTDRSRDFLAIFDEAFAAACREENLPPGYRLEVERHKLRGVARHVTATEQWEYDATATEVPLTLELAQGVAVSARIDRIDTIGRECVIVDYKSGKTASLLKKLESPTHLQGPLYALAVRAQLGLDPVAVIFWAVRDDVLYGWGAAPGAADLKLWPMPADWATAARVRIEERLAGYLAGAVTAHPEDPSQCRFCDFADACRVESAELIGIAGVAGE